MLYHLPDPADGLRELRRIVGPGGVVMATTNGRGHLAEYHPWVEAAAGRPLTRPGSTFTLEDRAMVEAVLGPVELVDWRSVVRLDTVEPLLAYLESTGDFFASQVDERWFTVRPRPTRPIARPAATSSRPGARLPRQHERSNRGAEPLQDEGAAPWVRIRSW